MGDKLLCLKSDCPDRWESVSEHFVLMKLRAEAHKLREERNTLLAALEGARVLSRWLAGSADFGPDGQAWEGWLKFQPERDAVDAALRLLGGDDE